MIDVLRHLARGCMTEVRRARGNGDGTLDAVPDGEASVL